MTNEEFDQSLLRLGLSPVEAAQLLTVSPRTVRRWQDGEEVPGPAQQAIRAWVRLQERHLPWRPDSASISLDDQDQIARHRTHMVDLDSVLAGVETRGGSKLPWSVDWDRGQATLGPIIISFYKLARGSFSLGTYRRTDNYPDTIRDREMIEDAIYCISQALKKKNPEFGPVTVVVHDGPAKGRVAKQRLEKFPTAKAAVKHVCECIGSPGFHDPFIITDSPSELLWDTRELQRECVRRSCAPGALAALADYVRTNSSAFVQDGPGSFGPSERAQREKQIKALADEIDKLAVRSAEGSVQYQQFDEALGALHAAGFFPAGGLVGAAAKALDGVKL
jgi:hypothetical protein